MIFATSKQCASQIQKGQAMVAGQFRGEDSSAEPRDALRQLAILADDLTGACDAAIAFTTVAHPVRVVVHDAELTSSGVCAATSNTRDIPAEEAIHSVATFASALPAGLPVFKKIDSVFRGNTFVEIVTAARCFPADLVVLAPAYPAVGRRQRAGVLHVQDLGGEQLIYVRQALAQHGCSASVVRAEENPDALRQDLLQHLANPQPLLLFDAWTSGDLIAVVQAVKSLRLRVLWIGSGGLAHALAASFRPLEPLSQPELRPGSPIFFVGSDHATTLQQVRYLQTVSRLVPKECNSSAPAAEDGLLLTIARGQTQQGDIHAALASVSPENTSCLFMTGGDTALLVCRALGIRSLQLIREFAPGVPLALAEGGRFNGIHVILKSGGFGEPDLLCRIHHLFGRKEKALA